MSPEVLQGLDVGPKDDIYSFGITMWQLKTNSYPYSSIKSNDIVAYRVVKHQIRPDIQCFSEQQNANKSNVCSKTQFEYHQTFDCFKCSNLNNWNYTDKLNYNLQNLSKSPFKSKSKNLLKTPEKRIEHLQSSLVHQRRKRSMTDETDVKQILLKIKSKQQLSPKIDQINTSQKNQFLIDCFEKNVQNENNLQFQLSDEFDEIYKNCWKADYCNRPSAIVLCEWFYKLLEKYKRITKSLNPLSLRP